MVGFTVKIDDTEVRAALRQLASFGSRLGPTNKRAAIYLTSQIKNEHFNREVDEEGNPWPPMHRLTAALRRKGGGKGAPKLLKDTGRLRNSIIYRADNAGFAVGTNVLYAAIQQFGGVIVPKKGAFLFIPIPGGRRGVGGNVSSQSKRLQAQGYRVFKTKDGGSAWVALRRVKIPARPYIYATMEELKAIADIYLREIDRMVEQSFGT